MNNMGFSNNSQKKTTIKITGRYKHIHYTKIHDILDTKRNMMKVPNNELLLKPTFYYQICQCPSMFSTITIII
jgi:hypothetical protein